MNPTQVSINSSQFLAHFHSFLLHWPQREVELLRDVSIYRSLLRDKSILHLTFPRPLAFNVRALSPRTRQPAVELGVHISTGDSTAEEEVLEFNLVIRVLSTDD